jgi:signal transduction histidine kinase
VDVGARAGSYAPAMTWDRVSRWLAARPVVPDAVGVAVVALVVVPWSFSFDTVGGEQRAAGWAALLLAPLALRRVLPVGSAVAVFAVAALHVLVGPLLVLPADLAVLVALYSVSVHGPRWAGIVAMFGVLVGAVAFAGRLLLVAGTAALDIAATGAVLISVTGLAVWALALLRRTRRATVVALRDRADRLERERDQQARLAAADERARIAREMHDVVAHSLSIVIAQADGGRYAAELEPRAAARALDTIGETGRAALADMRRILGVLRADQLGEDGPDLAPQPATDDLERLIDQVRASGVQVSLVQVGTPQALAPGIGLTVFRICQEALTNVLKHAGPDATVTVRQRWGPSSLVLEISDDGRGAAAEDDGAGHGLLGMRERVALFDGTMHAGPRPGGGFEVRVELPLPPPASRPAASDPETSP